jgi:hypothetical protein
MIGTPEERRTSRELQKKVTTKAHHTDCYSPGFRLNNSTRFPVRWSGDRNVMTICFEPQGSHRSLSLTFSKGNVSPRCARSFDSDNRAECLHLRQYAP